MASVAARQNPTHPTPESILSAVQLQVIAALAKGRTISAAAAEVQVHRTTIYGWLKTAPAFREALADARAEYALATFRPGWPVTSGRVHKYRYINERAMLHWRHGTSPCFS